jgi:hypothetical protein
MTALLASFFLVFAVCQEPAAKAAPPPPAPPHDAAMPPEEEAGAKLARVRRIYVDVLTGGEHAIRIRDMLIGSLQQSKAFMITENEDRADATLKGTADDQTFTERHEISDGLSAHASLGRSEGSRSRYDGLNRSASSGVGVTDREASRIEERRHEAFAALRLVDKDGDVIWSGTTESPGGKFAGASADVADRAAKQLVEDYRRAKLRYRP